LEDLSEQINSFSYRDYTRGAKRTYFKINMTKNKEKKKALFEKQLMTFTKTINQVSDIAFRKELKEEKVPNKEKIFSIYEQHTDIIVKGGRESVFGHKINLATGSSNLVLHCDVLKGNPSDKTLYPSTLDQVMRPMIELFTTVLMTEDLQASPISVMPAVGE
jgi:transposase, IS5 family